MLIPAVGVPMIEDSATIVPAPRARMPGTARAKHAHHALEVDVERMIPQGVGHRLERHAMRDAGIGNDGVDTAEFGLSMGEDRLHRLGAPHVERVEAGKTAGRDMISLPPPPRLPSSAHR